MKTRPLPRQQSTERVTLSRDRVRGLGLGLGSELGLGLGLGFELGFGPGSGLGHLHLVGVSEAKGDRHVAHGTVRLDFARLRRVVLVIAWLGSGLELGSGSGQG